MLCTWLPAVGVSNVSIKYAITASRQLLVFGSCLRMLAHYLSVGNFLQFTELSSFVCNIAIGGFLRFPRFPLISSDFLRFPLISSDIYEFLS